MAEIRIQTAEPLPRLCIRCGKPADAFQRRTFYWEEPKEELSAGDKATMGVGLLLDVASGSGGLSRRPKVIKTLSLDLPFCEQHRYPTRRFALLVLALIVAAVGGVVLLALDDTPEESGHALASVLGVLLLLGALISLALAFALRRRLCVRAGNDREAVVAGVAPEFVQALLALRRQIEPAQPGERTI
jgi:hypothetical protein